MVEIEDGKEYIITHTRKGMFAMRVDSQDDTWVNGVIVGGATSTMMAYNEKEKGDNLSIRREFIMQAIEQPPILERT